MNVDCLLARLALSCVVLSTLILPRLAYAGPPGVEQAGETGGETSYNGIPSPAQWPPRRSSLPRDPVPPPYLESPPAVIPIDVGRQLFVDDFPDRGDDAPANLLHWPPTTRTIPC